MKDVRFEQQGSVAVLVQIQCECGNNVMENAENDGMAFKHEVFMGSGREVELHCECGRAYKLRPQNGHVHVAEAHPPIRPGTTIVTTAENADLSGEWTGEAKAARKWGVNGTIIGHHDSHGLCYVVLHEDGSEGVYNPSEIRIAKRKKQGRDSA